MTLGWKPEKGSLERKWGNFQRIHFSRKRSWKRATSLLNQIVKINLLSQITRSQVNASFGDFLTVITNFLWALSQKEDDFSWTINQVLRIFWFQALWKPRFENKRNFWINCVCIKAFASWHAPSGHLHHSLHQWDIRIIACTNGTFASWHITKRTFVSWRTHKGAFASLHTQKGHLHQNICIMKFASWQTH